VASQIRAGELAAVEMEKNKGAAGAGVKVLIFSSFLAMQPGLKLFDHLREGLFHNLKTPSQLTKLSRVLYSLRFAATFLWVLILDGFGC
jgi:hypothetical protein